MITPDIPAEAVEAGLDWYEHDAPAGCDHWEAFGPPEGMPTLCLRCKWEGMLAAALPHLHAQWLAEVEGALRDRKRFFEWQLHHSIAPPGPNQFASYLRDVLGAGAGGDGE